MMNKNKNYNLNEESKITTDNKDCSYKPFGGVTLSPWYVTALIDGEGSFKINMTPDSTRSCGYKINFEIKVTQKEQSAEVLYAILQFYECGSIVIDNREDQ